MAAEESEVGGERSGGRGRARRREKAEKGKSDQGEGGNRRTIFFPRKLSSNANKLQLCATDGNKRSNELYSYCNNCLFFTNLLIASYIFFRAVFCTLFLVLFH